MICAATVLTVLIGTAKPIPTLPLAPESPAEIWRVDADHVAAGVEQRPARVALVQRGVGLDHVVDRVAVRRADHALQRADDPGRDGAVVAERIADRDDRVAHVDGVRVAERERRQRPRVRVDLQHSDVGGRVGADELRLHALVVREAHVDRARALDDVVVRDDVAGLVDHEARAERLGLLLAWQREAERVDARRSDPLRRRHLDDSRRGAPKDLVDGERRAGRLERDGPGHGWRLHADRRGPVVEAAEERSAAEGEGAAEHGRGHEPTAVHQPHASCHDAVIAGPCSTPVARR